MKILILDDQPEDAEQIRDLFQKAFPTSEIVCEVNIHAALPRANGGGLAEFDFFVVDIYFDTKADGLALIDSLRRFYPFTPILALSDTIDANDGVTAKRRGATHFEYKRNLRASDFSVGSLCAIFNQCDIAVNRRVLLHISDLHASKKNAFEPDTLVSIIYADVQRVLQEIAIDRVNYLVVSGDVADHADHQEYSLAESFIDQLIERLSISREAVVLVPGNHDVDWQAEWYDLFSKARMPEANKARGQLLEDVWVSPRPGGYSKRFENYMNFSRRYASPRLTQTDADHGWCITFREDYMQFYCLNSACQIDEFNAQKIVVPPRAVTSAIEEGKRDFSDADVRHAFRACVVHHPPSGPESIQNPEFLGRLVDEKVTFLFHGHVHETNRESVYKHTQGRLLNVVGCGSLSATKKHRPEGVPTMYHIVEINRKKRVAKIHGRAQRAVGSGFEPYLVWRTASALSSDSFYTCQY